MQFDSAFYRSAEWKAARAERLKLDNYTCTQCPSKIKLEVHHRISISAGGSRTAMYNLQTICKKCHDHIHPHLYNAKNKKKSVFKMTRL